MDILEKDWKVIRAMKDRILAMACKRILVKLKAIIDTGEYASHETYLEIWRVIKEEDAAIAYMFDDLRRNNALDKLASWKRNGLVSDEEMLQFSQSTQETVRRFLSSL
jgi:hypothetical protein